VELRHLAPECDTTNAPNDEAIGVRVNSLDRKNKVCEMQNAIRSGYDYRFQFDSDTDFLGSVLDGQWTFVMDANDFKIVSAGNPFVELTILSHGFKASYNYESSSDLTLLGKQKLQQVLYSGGRVQKLSFEPASTTTKHRLYNIMGITSPLQTAPAFATDIWEKIFLNSMLTDVRAAFLKILDRVGPSSTSKSQPSTAFSALQTNSTYSTTTVSSADTAENHPSMLGMLANFSLFPFQSSTPLSPPSTSPSKMSQNPVHSGENGMRKEKLVFEQANPAMSTPLPPNSSSSSSVVFYDRIYMKLLELCANHIEKDIQHSAGITTKESGVSRSVLSSDYLALYLEQVKFDNTLRAYII